MNKLDISDKKEIYIRNKGRIERAVWFEIELLSGYITYNSIGIDTRNYSSEFIDNLPEFGSKFDIIVVSTWKKYPAKMHTQQFWISSGKLYRDNEKVLKEGRIVGIAMSPENINEMWIDLGNGEESLLDRDKEKIITLSMISIRPFSEKFSLDLQEKKVRGKFKEIIISSYDLLKELNLVRLDKDDLFGREDWIDPLVNLFLINSRSIQKTTKGLFKNSGNIAFFLDVSKKSEITKNDIITLLNTVVGKDYRCLDRISDFCISTSRNRSADFFNPYEHIFSKPEYDNIMKDIIVKDIRLSNLHKYGL